MLICFFILWTFHEINHETISKKLCLSVSLEPSRLLTIVPIIFFCIKCFIVIMHCTLHIVGMVFTLSLPVENSCLTLQAHHLLECSRVILSSISSWSSAGNSGLWVSSNIRLTWLLRLHWGSAVLYYQLHGGHAGNASSSQTCEQFLQTIPIKINKMLKIKILLQIKYFNVHNSDKQYKNDNSSHSKIYHH